MVVGRLLSYWEGTFSGAMLNFWEVIFGDSQFFRFFQKWLNVPGLKAPSSSPALASRSGLFSAPSPPASTKGGKCESGAMKNQKMAGESQGVCYC